MFLGFTFAAFHADIAFSITETVLAAFLRVSDSICPASLRKRSLFHRPAAAQWLPCQYHGINSLNNRAKNLSCMHDDQDKKSTLPQLLAAYML